MKKLKLSDDFRGASLAGLFLVSLFGVIFTYGISMVFFVVYALFIGLFTESILIKEGEK